jgi:hypothetical protein
MAAPITLTAAQEAALTPYRDSWLAWGLSTDPADRDTAVQGLQEVYAAAGYAWPGAVLWVSSPLAGAITAFLLRTECKSAGKLSPRLTTCLEANSWDVWQAVLDSLDSRQKDQVRDALNEANFGQHEAGWLGFYDWYGSVLGQDISKVAGHIKVGQSCSFFWPYLEITIVCDRPSVYTLDDRHRLHSDTGPALGYRDGFAVYAHHGIWVEKHVIEAPDTISAEEVQAERNAEIRRVLLEKLTPARYVQKAGLNPIDVDPDPVIGTLYRADLPGDEPLLMLKVQNGTPEPVEWLIQGVATSAATRHRGLEVGSTHTLCGRVCATREHATRTSLASRDLLCGICESEASKKGLHDEYREFWLQVPERGGTDGKHGGSNPVIKTALAASNWTQGLAANTKLAART